MDDRQIVAGVRDGDRDAVAAMYGAYADVLHDYARRRTHSEADAADVVHDAFLVAVERIEQLRDPERLRPWLYAIARTELHRRYRHAARYLELHSDDGWQEPVSPEPGPDVQVERSELVALLREATAGLADADRELLDLHLRHGLVGADLAAAAGMPARHASVALERVKGRLTRTLGVVLLSRRPTCQEFAAIRDAQPELTPLARKRLARHVDNCEVCQDEQARRMRPEVLLSAVPMLPAPPDLRHRLVASHGRIPPTGQYWDDDGFPWPSRPRSHRRWLGWVAAAVAVLLVLGGTALVARPLVTKRTVALETTTPAPTTSTAPLAVPGAVLVPATPTTTEPTTSTGTTTTRTTTTRPTTTTTVPPTTTTTPPDTEPPEIDTATLDPRLFCTVDRSGSTTCGVPVTTARVSAFVADPSGLASVTMSWSAAGRSGSATMSPGPDGVHTAVAGPVRGDSVDCGYYDLSVTIVARDTAGNEAKRSTTFGRAVRDCAP